MRIHLLAVGTRPPGWIKSAYEDYARRLPRECRLLLTEIAPARRDGRPLDALRQEEGRRLLHAVPAGARLIALDGGGQQWSTEELAGQLGRWLQDGRDLTLLVGGADGLDPACLARAEAVWSLSRLTFPHLLVRIIVAEQLYRAWSLLNHHPYHRA